MKPANPRIMMINDGSPSLRFTLFEGGDSRRRIPEGGIDLIRVSAGVFNLEWLNHTEPETATVKTLSGLVLEFTDATVHHADSGVVAYRELALPLH